MRKPINRPAVRSRWERTPVPIPSRRPGSEMAGVGAFGLSVSLDRDVNSFRGNQPRRCGQGLVPMWNASLRSQHLVCSDRVRTGQALA